MDIIYRINGGALTLLANQTSPTNISGTAGDSVEVWLSEKQTATVQSASSNWTPSNISTMTLAAWYDADDAATITATSGSVDQWSDKSGNGYHMTATTTERPTTGTQTINSKNVLDFNGTSNTMSAATGWQAGSSNNVIMAVVQFDAIAAAQRIVGGFADAGTRHNLSFDQPSGVKARFTHASSYVAVLSSGSPTAATTHLFSGYRSGTSAGGCGIDATYATDTNFSTAPTLNAWRIGSSNSSSEYLDGKIAEIVVCLGYDLTEREKLEGYLAHKWGIAASLPGGHPYAPAAPTT